MQWVGAPRRSPQPSKIPLTLAAPIRISRTGQEAGRGLSLLARPPAGCTPAWR